MIVKLDEMLEIYPFSISHEYNLEIFSKSYAPYSLK
jgi:hypothetical protein